MLASVIKIKKNRELSQDCLEEILIDATEIQIQRPKKKQREFYSGKKKKHTIKFEIQIDTSGKILNISKAYCGKTHDFKIRKTSEHVPIRYYNFRRFRISRFARSASKNNFTAQTKEKNQTFGRTKDS